MADHTIKIIPVAMAIQLVLSGLLWAAETAAGMTPDAKSIIEKLSKVPAYADLQCTTISEQHATANVEHQSELKSLEERNHIG